MNRCRGNYRWSIEVARLCFAWLLGSSKKVVQKKAVENYHKKGSANGFLDAGIIKDALFFGAKILTQDKGVDSMANCCGIKAIPKLNA